MAGVMEICLGRCSFCDVAANRRLLLTGDPKRPARICRSCVARFLDDANAAIDGAREASGGGNSRDASPRTRWDYEDDAARYLRTGQVDRAIQELMKILVGHPANVRTRLKLGDLFAKTGQNANAAAQYIHVAESYSSDGFLLKAVAVYKQVLKLDPSLIDVHRRLGDLYQQLGLSADAAIQFQIVAQRPSSAPVADAPSPPASVRAICSFCNSPSELPAGERGASIWRECLEQARGTFSRTST
jgi:tetratricopeptide (TPR) repeat protein